MSPRPVSGNVIIAMARADTAQTLRRLVSRDGYQIITVTASGAQALAAMENADPGILICGHRLSDMGYATLIEDMPAAWRMILLASPSHVEGEISLPESVVYLPLPLQGADLLQTLTLLCEGVSHSRRGRAQHGRAGRSAQEEALLTRAKALLMERHHMTEPEAHHYLQKRAMDSGVTILEAAEMVEVLNSP